MLCIDCVFFLSFCSDLFQDLSQLQETWLTEGETCLQADFSSYTVLFCDEYLDYDSHEGWCVWLERLVNIDTPKNYKNT